MRFCRLEFERETEPGRLEMQIWNSTVLSGKFEKKKQKKR